MRQRPTVTKTPEQIAADVEYAEFMRKLESQGGKYWVGNAGPARVYFERTTTEYAAEVDALRKASGGFLAVWPEKKLGYVIIDTREFISTRTGVSNEQFKASLGF